MNKTQQVLLGIIIIIILLGICSIVLYQREGFTMTPKLTKQFLQIQRLLNPNIVFDTEQIQKQVTKEELLYFIQNKKWYWSKNTELLYTNALQQNPYIRTDPQDAINTIRTIYNEKAILQMLSWQTKEGQFLLHGIQIYDKDSNPNEFGEFAYNSGQIEKKDKVIRCDYNTKRNPFLVQDTYSWQNGYNGYQTSPINYKDLETTIQGFSFLDKPCNPCQALQDPPNYNCPFTLELPTTKKEISPVWKYLWSS